MLNPCVRRNSLLGTAPNCQRQSRRPTAASPAEAFMRLEIFPPARSLWNRILSHSVPPKDCPPPYRSLEPALLRQSTLVRCYDPTSCASLHPTPSKGRAFMANQPRCDLAGSRVVDPLINGCGAQ